MEERDATASPVWKAELMSHTHDTGVVPIIVRDSGEVHVGFPPRGG